jgi:hemoglobin
MQPAMRDVPELPAAAPLALDESGLRQLVDAFYAAVRADDMIGPLFNDAIGDWPRHLAQLSAFWSSVMLTSGRYKGQPMPAHLKHKSRITPEMFERWLALWRTTTDRLMRPEDARALQDKAARIAESLSLALFFRLEPKGR